MHKGEILLDLGDVDVFLHEGDGVGCIGMEWAADIERVQGLFIGEVALDIRRKPEAFVQNRTRHNLCILLAVQRKAADEREWVLVFLANQVSVAASFSVLIAGMRSPETRRIRSTDDDKVCLFTSLGRLLVSYVST